MTYTIEPHWLERKVRVLVVGAGGTGSHVINGLVQLHTALIALGHPAGLHVTVIDDDTVSESNVGRQAFVWSDIGQPKATVLVNRLNQAYGLNWDAHTARLSNDEDHWNFTGEMVIGCVDNRAARSAISKLKRPSLWLDMGNSVNEGQIVLGELGNRPTVWVRGEKRLRIPTIADLFPETANAQLDAADDAPSCSLAEALEKQGLFINRAMALHGLNLLWLLFRHGSLDHHGLFVNLANGRTQPLMIDPATWARMGYSVTEEAAQAA